MVSILSFDSRSMKILLDDKNSSFFQSQFPIFYKNKIQKSNNKNKFFYRSAIDSALRNNQIQAVNFILSYIVKYQNNFVSSFLFQKNMRYLMEKGIEVSGLLNSHIFCFSFDFDEWPSTHTNQGEYHRPFNDSIFNLRNAYSKIFFEERFADITTNEDEIDSRKVYKVNYQINMLPSLGEYMDKHQGLINEGVSLMDLCCESDELDIFESKNFHDLIKFKWDNFAF